MVATSEATSAGEPNTRPDRGKALCDAGEREFKNRSRSIAYREPLAYNHRAVSNFSVSAPKASRRLTELRGSNRDAFASGRALTLTTAGAACQIIDYWPREREAIR